MSVALWIKLDVEFASDEKVLACTGEAQLVYLRSLLLSKKRGSDGFVHGRQLRLLAGADDWQNPINRDDLAGQLVDAGLWEATEGGWLIAAWPKHNELSDASESGIFGNHVRWHTNRGNVDTSCPHCCRPDAGPDTPDNQYRPDSGGESPSIAREEKSREENTTSPTARRGGDHASLEATFEELWMLYPPKRRVGKAKTRSSLNTALSKEHADPDTIIAGLRADLIAWQGKPEEFIPHSTTWVNQRRWENALAPSLLPLVDPEHQAWLESHEDCDW